MGRTLEYKINTPDEDVKMFKMLHFQTKMRLCHSFYHSSQDRKVQ